MDDPRFAPNYQPFYEASRALVVGISQYASVGPALENARRDAEQMAETLRRCGFQNPQVIVDRQATKQNILDSLHALTTTNPDDRVVVFYSGHGAYAPAFPREQGFLVPYDAVRGSLNSLIAWHDFRLIGSMIPAKHVVFFFDACFSGLAKRRNLLAGSSRFVRSNLIRRSRQVLTAGTGIQTVADVGEQMVGYSPMTYKVIEALNGRAAYGDGIITGINVMHYVYNEVGRDTEARQRPDYDQYEGDGDFVFAAAEGLTRPAATVAVQRDVLVPVRAVGEPEASDPTLAARVKGYLADPAALLRLHDIVTTEVRRVIALIEARDKPTNPVLSDAEFGREVGQYDAALYDLCVAQALLGHWGAPPTVLTLAAKRLCDRITPWSNVITPQMRLEFYPALRVLYAGGIAAVAARRYDTLFTLFHTTRMGLGPSPSREPLMRIVMKGIGKTEDQKRRFLSLIGDEQSESPRSRHLFTTLQPALDDALFLGSDYEEAFDRFEVMCALEYGLYRRYALHADYGFPTGRFADDDPPSPVVQDLLSEALAAGEEWGPIKAGLFGGVFEYFQRGIEKLQAQLASR